MPLPIPRGASAADKLFRVARFTPPGGTTPLEFLVRRDSYRERFTNATDGDPPGGATATATVIIRGEDVGAFVPAFLGYTRPPASPGGTLRRTLPYALPFALPFFKGSLYARSLVLAEYKTYGAVAGESDGWPADAGAPPAADPVLYGWPVFDHLTYRAEFEDRPYALLADADTLGVGPAPELLRYVERSDLPQARERKVPAWSVETAEGATVNPTTGAVSGGTAVPLAETGFVIDRTASLQYVWHQVPEACFPAKTIAGLAGCVNSVPFDPDGRNYPAGEVLYEGPAEKPVRHRMRNGELAYTVRFSLRHRPGGWNYYRKPSDPAVLIPWRIKDTTRPVYPLADLNTLFVPGA